MKNIRAYIFVLILAGLYACNPLNKAIVDKEEGISIVFPGNSNKDIVSNLKDG